MADIHPAACVEAGASIGAGTQIGPFCYVSGAARIGANVKLHPNVTVAGETSIGDGCEIFSNAALGFAPQDTKHKGGQSSLSIGENCTIREGVTINSGSDSSTGKTVIGNDCLFLINAHIAHDCRIGNGVTLINNVMLGGHCEIDDHVIIGGGAALHQHVRVGTRAFIGGLAGISADVIPYGYAMGYLGILAGLNIVGMKRAGMKKSDLHIARSAYNMLFDDRRPLLENIDPVAEAYPDHPIIKQIVAFLRSDSKRSFISPSKEEKQKIRDSAATD